MNATPPPSERATLRRRTDRGRYEREAIDAVLDEGLVCHLAFVTDTGPVVLPTTYVRVGDDLVVHGSPATRLLRTLARGVDVCVTVTLLDALVLARSAYHHSMNYRSVVVFGTAVEVTDLDEKRAAMDALVDHIAPGRAREARPPTERELRGTLVLRIPLDESSAKLRTGPPVDDEDDLALDVWAGIVPVHTVFGEPLADVGVSAAVPPSVRRRRGG